MCYSFAALQLAVVWYLTSCSTMSVTLGDIDRCNTDVRPCTMRHSRFLPQLWSWLRYLPFFPKISCFWATVCKTVHPMLSNHCLSLRSVLYNVGVLWPNGWTDQDETWHAGRPRPGHIVLDGDPAPPPPIFGPYMLRPNGCMDQDATWYGSRPWPRRLCVRRGPRSPFLKSGGAPKIFGPCLLLPKGCMDEAGTWHGGRPQPRRLCVRWGPSPLPKKGAEPPNFRLMSIAAKRLHGSTCHLVRGKPRPRLHCVRWGPSSPSPKRGRRPLPNFQPMSVVAKRLDGSRWQLAWRWALVQATLC